MAMEIDLPEENIEERDRLTPYALYLHGILSIISLATQIVLPITADV